MASEIAPPSAGVPEPIVAFSPVGAVLHPEAVRPDDAHAARPRGRDDALLQRGALRADLGEPAGEHDDGAGARAGRVLDHARDRRRRYGRHDEVDRARHVAHAAVGAQAGHLLAPGADRDDLAREAVEVAHEGRAELAGLVGGAHHRDAPRVEDLLQPAAHAAASAAARAASRSGSHTGAKGGA